MLGADYHARDHGGRLMFKRVAAVLLVSICDLVLVASPKPASRAVTATLIENVTIVDVIHERLILHQNILIRGEKIAGIGSSPFATTVQRRIDGSHLVAIPGFVNTHTHLWQHVAKSVEPSGTLQEWIPRVYGVADYLTDSELHDVTLAAASQALLSGITTTVDFTSVNYADTAVPTTMRALHEAGIDGVVIWWDPAAFLPPDVKELEVQRLNHLDPNHIQVWVGPGPLSFFPLPAVNSAILLARATGTRLAEHTMENVQEQRDFADRANKYLQTYKGRIAPAISAVLSDAIAAPLPAVDGVHALRRNAQELLSADDAKQIDAIPDADQRMLSASDRALLASVATTAQPSPLSVLHKLGALPGFLSIHSVWLDNHDVELLKQNHASVSLNPESNMYLSSGIAPLMDYLRNGINVTIGTDGAASNDGIDFFSAMRAEWNLQKVHALDTEVTRTITAWDILRAATINGAKAIDRDAQTGSIDIGKEADLVLLSTDSLGMAPIRDATTAALIVNSACARDVRYVFSNGRLLVQNGRLTHFDEAQLARRLTQVANRSFARSTAGKTWQDSITARPGQFLYRTIRKRDTVDLRITNTGSTTLAVTLAFSGTAFGGTAAPVLRAEALKITPLDPPKAYHERTIDLAPHTTLTLAKMSGSAQYSIHSPTTDATRDMPEREQVFIHILPHSSESRSPSLVTLPLTEYVARVASLEPAPGGGSVAASTGLLGTAMMMKAVRISSKNNPTADGLVRSLEEQSRIIAAAIDEDAVAFAEYLRATRLPKDTEEQRSRRAPIVEAAREHSLAVPLKTGHALLAIAQLAINAEPLCKDALLSDLAGGALLVQAAARSALLNVSPNLSGVAESRRAQIIAERDAIDADVASATQRLLDAIAARQH